MAGLGLYLIFGPQRFEYEMKIMNKRDEFQERIHTRNTYNIMIKKEREEYCFWPAPAFRAVVKFCWLAPPTLLTLKFYQHTSPIPGHPRQNFDPRDFFDQCHACHPSQNLITSPLLSMQETLFSRLVVLVFIYVFFYRFIKTLICSSRYYWVSLSNYFQRTDVPFNHFLCLFKYKILTMSKSKPI